MALATGHVQSQHLGPEWVHNIVLRQNDQCSTLGAHSLADLRLEAEALWEIRTGAPIGSNSRDIYRLRLGA